MIACVPGDMTNPAPSARGRCSSAEWRRKQNEARDVPRLMSSKGPAIVTHSTDGCNDRFWERYVARLWCARYQGAAEIHSPGAHRDVHAGAVILQGRHDLIAETVALGDGERTVLCARDALAVAEVEALSVTDGSRRAVLRHRGIPGGIERHGGLPILRRDGCRDVVGYP